MQINIGLSLLPGNYHIGRAFLTFYDHKGRLRVPKNKGFRQVEAESNSAQIGMSDLE